MSDAFQEWLLLVKASLETVNMAYTEWQERWPFDFEDAFQSGVAPADAAAAANRHWWRSQNRALGQHCRLTEWCWLPEEHQGPCEPA